MNELNFGKLLEKMLDAKNKDDPKLRTEMLKTISELKEGLTKKKRLKEFIPDELEIDISLVMAKTKKSVHDTKVNLDNSTIIKGIPNVRGIDSIRSIIEILIKSVKVINPLLEAAKALDPDNEYNQMLDVLKREYASEFLLPEAMQFQSYLAGSIKELSSLMDKASNKGYLQNSVNRLDFLVVKGALSEIYHLINPLEGKLMVEDEFQGNDFFKPAHEILLTLASLSALELEDKKSLTKSIDDIKNEIFGLSESDRRIIVGSNLKPHWVLDQQENTQRQIFSLIAINDEGAMLTGEQINIIFGRMDLGARDRLLKLLLSSLTMYEVKALEGFLTKLGVK